MPYPIHTGLVPDLPDARDFRYADAMLSSAPIDWEAGFDAEAAMGVRPVFQDQGSSSSCVAQAAAAHLRLWHRRLTGEDVDFSRRFIYSQIALGYGNGAYLRDSVRLISSLGDCPEAMVPSYELGKPPSEAFMLSKDGMSQEAFLAALPFDRFTYRMIPGRSSDMEELAHAVRENCGAVGGFTGTDRGWTRPVVQPPQRGDRQWNHAVFISGFGTYEGQRCFFTRNSWGGRYAIQSGRWAGFQAIPEEYFRVAVDTAVGPSVGAYVFNSWALVPDSALAPSQKTMDFITKNEGKLVQDVQGKGAFGIIKGGKVLVADRSRVAELALTYLMRKEGVPVDAAMWASLPKDTDAFGPRA